MNINNNLLIPEQVAEILQIHILTVYSYIRQGKLDAIQLGRTYRIVPKDPEIFFKSNRIKNQQAKRLNIESLASESKASFRWTSASPRIRIFMKS